MAEVSKRVARVLEHEHEKQAPVKGSVDKKKLSPGAVFGISLNGLGSAEVVSCADVNVDTAYQRTLRHDLVNKIGREYDIVKAGQILLSVRDDGTLWCVDGQHRLAGAMQAGETEVFAHVVHGLTQEQEAELRLARNDRKGDSIQEKFRTRLVMGDEKAHAIVNALHQYGTQVNYTNSNTHSGVNAIATLEVLWDVDGQGTWLGRTLRFLNEAFPPVAPSEGEPVRSQLTPRIASAAMMKAVAWFIDRHIDTRQVSWDDMVERVGAVGVEDIRRKAVSHKAAQGGSEWLNHYRAMVDIYNFRRTDQHKIMWITAGSISTLGTSANPTSQKPWSK